MGFENGWIANPAYPGQDEAGTTQDRRPLPAFETAEEGTLGPVWSSLTGTVVKQAFLEVDPDQWLEGPDRTHYVLGLQSSLTEVWVQRSCLGDPAYEATASAIRKHHQLELEMLEEFWQKKRALYQNEDGTPKTVTLDVPMQGFNPDTRRFVNVEAGTYPCRLGGRKIPDEPQLSPFTVALTVGDASVLINPDRLGGVVTEHNTEAGRQGLANTITAAEVRRAFTAAPSILTPYVPQDEWLKEEHLHYTTADQMGAVFVRRAMPADDHDVDMARKEDQGLFNVGADTPGVRFGDHIFIQRDQLGIGVEHHEAIHRLSHPGVHKILGFGFNEGVTEYFTRALFTAAGERVKVVRTEDQYGPQHDGVKALIDHGVLTESDLCEAYFLGRLKNLFDKATARFGHRFSLQAYALYLNGGYASAAQRRLEELL
ncbi:hypothetical protein [Planomonospora venezuelensis]|uniref:Uncharacterized protein n=1 Tax=Planomonospora venezuelensis TaxID=1999 RepID=A0A841DAW4_PLAVE|nr:hypothetical protein [Planomonospora venezuelensis]MBB5967782.1 hypothetical protein [Planomonospora venezuelensis]GIN05825.1 hypothetical protein Pve01_74830 [Planomonospora venezuelensis]